MIAGSLRQSARQICAERLKTYLVYLHLLRDAKERYDQDPALEVCSRLWRVIFKAEFPGLFGYARLAYASDFCPGDIRAVTGTVYIDEEGNCFEAD